MIPIFSILNSSDEVKDIFKSNGILRAYEFGLAPEECKREYPYLVWQIIGGEPINHIDEPPNDDQITVQIDIYSVDVESLKPSFNVVRRALHKYCYVTGFHGEDKDLDGIYRTGFTCDWLAPI